MSDVLKSAHEMAQALHRVGAMADATMRRMDELCMASHGKVPMSAGEFSDDMVVAREANRMGSEHDQLDRLIEAPASE